MDFVIVIVNMERSVLAETRNVHWASDVSNYLIFGFFDFTTVDL